MSSFFTIDENTTELKDFDRITELQVLTKIKQQAIEEMDGCRGFSWANELLECNSIYDLFKDWNILIENKKLTEHSGIYNSRLVDIIFTNIPPLLTDGSILLYNWDYDYGNYYHYSGGAVEYEYKDFSK